VRVKAIAQPTSLFLRIETAPMIWAAKTIDQPRRGIAITADVVDLQNIPEVKQALTREKFN
jgi:hypothetical protein